MTQFEKFKQLVDEYAKTSMTFDENGFCTTCKCCVEKALHAVWDYVYDIGVDEGYELREEELEEEQEAAAGKGNPNDVPVH